MAVKKFLTLGAVTAAESKLLFNKPASGAHTINFYINNYCLIIIGWSVCHFHSLPPIFVGKAGAYQSGDPYMTLL